MASQRDRFIPQRGPWTAVQAPPPGSQRFEQPSPRRSSVPCTSNGRQLAFLSLAGIVAFSSL